MALVLLGDAVPARSAPPLYDPVILNIGLNCQWQQHCMRDQQRAMRHALKYVSKYHPPLWRIQQCNRNAARYPGRVDWTGFNNCVRNAALIYVPPRPQRQARSAHHQGERHLHRQRHHRR